MSKTNIAMTVCEAMRVYRTPGSEIYESILRAASRRNKAPKNNLQ
jgi:hypothetical protein